MSATVDVELQVACRTHGVPSAEEVRSWIQDAVTRSGRASAGVLEVVVRAVDERESRALNYRFRKTDRPTNVLAFPAATPEELARLGPGDSVPLGDIAICAPVLEREAAEQGKTLAAHWAHLLVHGTLHLLGFGHDTEEEAAVMEGLEARILAARGLADPYAAD